MTEVLELESNWVHVPVILGNKQPSVCAFPFSISKTNIILYKVLLENNNVHYQISEEKKKHFTIL